MKFLNRIIKFCKLLKNKTSLKGLFHNIAANIELENLVKNLDFETVIDIGSNKGQFILLIEKLFNDKVIYSFEPIYEVLEKQKKFFKYKKNLFFYNIGLGDKKSKRLLNITNRTDSSSFLKVNQNEYRNHDYIIKEEREISVNTLDEVLKNEKIKEPILIKIDVQGLELEVLKGSINFLKKTKYIVVEVSDKEIYQNQSTQMEVNNFLKKNEFKILKENLPIKIKNIDSYQKDILFINKSID